MVLQKKTAVILLIICGIITISCNKSKKNMPIVSVDIETIPTVYTEGYSMLVSDSGMVRYRLNTNEWMMFSKVAEPYSYFPDGIHVEQFDSLFQVETEILADTAYHYEKSDLWHAIGNVVAKNKEGRIFETSELFWDRKVPLNTLNAFYTDKKVKVTEPNGTFFYGHKGFTADHNLNSPRFYDLSESELYIEESTDTPQQQMVKQDSIQAP